VGQFPTQVALDKIPPNLCDSSYSRPALFTLQSATREQRGTISLVLMTIDFPEG
jgi:hypothetical protein